ncbi:M20/M25/M40 family metallo-hydrolase [Gelidibacter japonicus]|uniref:M20/M25/M40 family metallo-hydrolase n=1 Tax=Gelidibacter japonicus TaxID=1962232 RepID=UPI0020226063|nr:M20/M25/M40 family metallo-hydrolase [Gelidibacter japonicus]MCL8006884.1 M20/M25/M40 family metallo-hydrolase [Gelidibacter japonicus]
MKKTSQKILILSALFISSLSFAQKGKMEKKIIKSVDQHVDASIDLLKKAVNINSGTMNFDGVKKVGELFKAELDQLGFHTELTSGEAYGRAGHLIAKREGKKGPKFLLIGHLDTVFELDSPFQEYTMIDENIMKGPGVADMKGGDVIIILAMKALKEAGVLDDMSIEIVMTGDEEKSGEPIELSKRDLIEAAKRADIALGFENGDNNPKTIVVARRGSSDWQLKVTGVPAHSSQVFTKDIGVGAIYEASRILNEFYLQLSKEKDLTFNPGFIIGGTDLDVNDDLTGGTVFGKNNVVAQQAIVHGDIRATSPEQLEKAHGIMKQIVANNYPNTSAELIFNENGYPPLALTEGNTKLLKIYDTVSQDLGFGAVEAVNPRNAGAADISFTSGYVDMALDGLGLTGGGGDHTIEETGDLRTVATQAKITAVLMYRLISTSRF